MSHRYDLYGSTELEPSELERLVEERLGIELSQHDSSAWGPYGRWSGPEGGQIRVTSNFIDEDGYLLEEDFPQHRSFVYLDEREDFASVDERLRGIEGLAHLRTKQVGT